MISVSRAGWDARPPESTTPLTRSKVSLFIVHYSGADRNQTVRSIQNYCMDVKDHVDIDYNRIVHGQYDYMGRGWNVGGHTKDHNSISYGVCMVGQNGDATGDDKRTIREIYDQVCHELGRNLVMTTHRGVLGASYTDCPGLDLHNWVMSGMPYPQKEEDSMIVVFGNTSYNGNVERLQRLLARAGASPGAFDGIYGEKTAAALASLIGGDGRAYGPTEIDLLDEILREKTFDRLVPGITHPELPKHANVVVPSMTLTLPGGTFNADLTP